MEDVALEEDLRPSIRKETETSANGPDIERTFRVIWTSGLVYDAAATTGV